MEDHKSETIQENHSCLLIKNKNRDSGGFQSLKQGEMFRIIFVSNIVCFLDKSSVGNILKLFVLTIRKACQQTPEV